MSRGERRSSQIHVLPRHHEWRGGEVIADFVSSSVTASGGEKREARVSGLRAPPSPCWSEADEHGDIWTAGLFPKG